MRTSAFWVRTDLGNFVFRISYIRIARPIDLASSKQTPALYRTSSLPGASGLLL